MNFDPYTDETPDPARVEALQALARERQAGCVTLCGKLEAEKQKRIEANGNGYAQDWADYKHRTGVIAGLHCALLICEEAMKELGD